ncbi:ATP-binding protein [Desulfitobacterium sp. THU1]|uniref:sensor histidine kinase n=1 Tax=Desulfitobacterium sp. THU1 TaxID=3138072 RepID=UPI00311F8119
MEQEKFFLYLMYGMVYILMGVFAYGKKEKEVSHIPLVRSLKYLGVFGITHGLSEWLAMVMIIDLYHDQYSYIYLANQVLKAISFAFLMYFGISLLPNKTRFKSVLNKLPISLFTIWLIYIIITLSKHEIAYLIANPKINVFLLRYCMALTGSISSAFALYMNAKLMGEINSPEIEKRYKRLAYIFLVYGLIDGLLLKEMDFFPANLINNSFLAEFSFSIKFVNIAIGIGVIYLLSKVMQTFGWEQKEKLKQLQQQKIIDEERSKLGLEIHDGIIQNIYAASLKLQYVLDNTTQETKTTELLQEIKLDLGDTIKKTREFISKTTLETIPLEDLKDQIERLVKVFNENQTIEFILKARADLSTSRRLSTRKSSQVYYIVQEAINNVVKHSRAKHSEVLLDFKLEYLHIKVIDNGIGISLSDLNSKDKYGIQSMKERAQQIDGLFSIKKLRKGTEVELIVPYEQGNHK